MKQLLRKLLYRDIKITGYSSVTLNGNISEKVFLKTTGFTIDVSQDHWVLCLEPIIYGIWQTRNVINPSFSRNNNYILLIEETPDDNGKKKKLAEVKLSFFNSIEEDGGTLLLFKHDKCKLFHTSFIETVFLFFRYFQKPGFSFKKFKSYVSAFSYPRKVRIISFKKEGYYNIFPMDFVGKIEGTNRYVFGLRHSNQTLNHIIESKKLVVSEVPFKNKNEIYELGRFHSSMSPPEEHLPFKTSPSRDFGFPVPDWAESYNEIGIMRTLNLGSHMLLWGESLHEEILKRGSGNLYHIHFLLFLFQKRRRANYTLV